MTTIAISEGVVAVDSQLTAGNQALRMQKLARLPDGGVAVIAGGASAGYAGLKWLVDGERGDPPDIEGASVIVVRPDGSIWLADDRWPAIPILGYAYAAGCGSDLARQLLAQGKDPVQAVAEACELDAMSSGPIFSMAVLPPREDPGVTIHKITNTRPRRSKARR